MVLSVGRNDIRLPPTAESLLELLDLCGDHNIVEVHLVHLGALGFIASATSKEMAAAPIRTPTKHIMIKVKLVL
jgi:hypothetical protein